MSAVLVLGGTAEARQIANYLQCSGIEVISSLAGRLEDPNLPSGRTRLGGFGGEDGLTEWLRAQRCAAVVDATHPFASRISASAVAACSEAGVPLLRLQRPGWSEQPGDQWHRVDDLETAADLTSRLGTRVLLTIGRQRLSAFAGVSDTWFLIRCIDPPSGELPVSREILLARGPFTLESELDLMRRYRIDLIVTRDSGGDSTEAKLHAARTLTIPVIMISRPVAPEAATVQTASEAVKWVRSMTSGPRPA